MLKFFNRSSIVSIVRMFINNHHIVYNQTWEDPFIDVIGLQPTHGDVVVCITSGGCNALNVSLHNPRLLYAVDKNFAQHALLHLKLAAIASLNYSQFWCMFGEARSKDNLVYYHDYVRDNLNILEKIYWDKYINLFSTGFYSVGKLGTLFLLQRWILFLCGKEVVKRFLIAKDLKTQRSLYFNAIKPRLWNWITQHIPIITMMLYGVSLRQILLSFKAGQIFLKDMFTNRLDNLFAEQMIKNNYFWQRILLGKYVNNRICPPYLQKKNFTKLKKSIRNIKTYNISIIKFLQTLKNSYVTKFNLSDIPGFLSSNDQIHLWNEVKRTGKNKSLVLYRSVSPNFYIPNRFSSSFRYIKILSEKLSKKEMTGSYAGVYVYQIHK